jgi:hypothetical protein
MVNKPSSPPGQGSLRFRSDGLARRGTAALLLAGALVMTSGAALPAAAEAGHAVRGTLLPLPTSAPGPGEQLTVTAVDVSPLGVVAGTAKVTTTAPDGTQSAVETPQRWARLPRVGWLRQQLALPDGATSGNVAALTDLGEAAGAVTLDGVSRAARWSVDGRSATLIGDARSRAGAVGPRGTWGVSTAGPDILSGQTELVARDGTRRLLTGTPELDAGQRRTVASIADRDTALVWVVAGIGRAATGRPVLWQDGATVPLPVISSLFLAPACVSPVRADGSVVASGYRIEGGVVSFVMVRHVGGVPGTDIVLSRATASGQPFGGIKCASEQASNSLAPDGGIAGYLVDADGRRSAAYWNAANAMTVVPLEAGEVAADGVAAAAGGRMAILAQREDGSTSLSLWRNGARTSLPAPAGWNVTSVVELTPSGLLIANVRDAAGTVRPAAWQVP